jgi:hypothetical protein
MPAIQGATGATGVQAQPIAITQAAVPQLAAVVAGNMVVGSAIAALQLGPSQLHINPVPGNPNAALIYAPSAATVAAILADLQALQTATLAQLASTYGVNS